MDIYECKRKAEKMNGSNITFKAHFPAGVFECKWLDQYMGLFVVDADGMRDGFVTVDAINDMFPGFTCSDLKSND